MPGSEGQEHSSESNTEQGQPQGEASPVPGFELARRVILGMIQAIGDGAELVGASLREELTSFRLELEHRIGNPPADNLPVEQYESIEHPTPKASQPALLAHLIDARGMSQAELARQSGVPRSVITNVLKGRRKLSQANIARLAKHFHVSPAAFLDT